ncbi:hypothetical protein T492DRAFT_1069498 [Pavlovales sp. CCMP2436]|nr:hypothetical protein T492DRAFT_1069498 [Pavlovales sp. CCMP2436]
MTSTCAHTQFASPAPPPKRVSISSPRPYTFIHILRQSDRQPESATRTCICVGLYFMHCIYALVVCSLPPTILLA